MRRIVPLLCIAALVACSDNPSVPTSVAGPRLSVSAAGPSSYVIDFTGETLPATLAADIRSAGGTLTASLDAIGVAVASSDDPSFPARASRIRGVSGVDPDVVLQWVNPAVAPAEVTVDESDVVEQSHEVGGHETFRLVQWAPDAISAPAAWAAGAEGDNQGAGARVAILDGGIRSTHIDIAPNLDVARSASFVPGFAFNADVGTFWHGTHVAGIVAAPANAIGTVGIAPRATLIGVKVLHNGSGSFSWVIQGIVYAAKPILEGGAGANIINLSLGAGFPKNGPEAAHLKNALSKAVTYAYQRGVTVIAAIGNDAIDLDHTANLIFVPAMSPHAIAVSALGPMGWALGSTDLDRPASYTNFGQSAVELAGPGGDFVLPGSAICVKPRLPSGTVINFCWVFDMVMAPCRGGGATSISSYCWAAGTSMASPAVAGVAALIVGKNPLLKPSEVRAILRASADDLGKPGNDDFYGRGRVNALRAVQ
ncbi:MAG: S8 family serine peptidase [Cytophagaceae bacterium]|nr:S8 family serine peptidase [Gemmatimonadaceae bacterium]